MYIARFLRQDRVPLTEYSTPGTEVYDNLTNRSYPLPADASIVQYIFSNDQGEAILNEYPVGVFYPSEPTVQYVVVALGTVTTAGMEALQTFTFTNLAEAQSAYATIDLDGRAPPATEVIELWILEPGKQSVLDAWRPIKDGSVSPTAESLSAVSQVLSSIGTDLELASMPIVQLINDILTQNQQDINDAITSANKQIGSIAGANTRDLNSVIAGLDATVVQDAADIASYGAGIPLYQTGQGPRYIVSGLDDSSQVQPQCPPGGGITVSFVYSRGPNVGKPYTAIQPRAFTSMTEANQWALIQTIGAIDENISAVFTPCGSQGAVSQSTQSVPSASQPQDAMTGDTQIQGTTETQSASVIQSVGQNGSAAVQCPQCGCQVNVTVLIPGLGSFSQGTTAGNVMSASGPQTTAGHGSPIVSPVVDFSNPFAHIAGLVDDKTAQEVEEWLGERFAGVWGYDSMEELVLHSTPEFQGHSTYSAVNELYAGLGR